MKYIKKCIILGIKLFYRGHIQLRFHHPASVHFFVIAILSLICFVIYRYF